MENEKIKARFEIIPLGRLEPNEGQIEGLPANPRDIVDRKFDLLKKDILMHPELLEIKRIMVIPHDEKMVIIGGNMRCRVLNEIAKMSPAEINIALGKCSGYAQLSADERECLRGTWRDWVKTDDKPIHIAILPEETPVEKLKAYAILDNSGFGRWQWDMLANEWDAEQLTEWGVDLPIMESEINTDEFFDNLDNEDGKEKGEKLTVTIPDEWADQKDTMKSIIENALTDFAGIKVK